MRFFAIAVCLVAAAFCAKPAGAAEYQLSLKDHQFVPSSLEVTPYKKHTITVKNLDSTPAELGSATLSFEPAIIEPDGTASITIDPLQPKQTHILLDVFHNDTECLIIGK